MAAWNLALRFGLELGALAGLAAAAWELTTGPARWIAAVLTPLVAAAVWGVFNVLDDPSRSGAAPVEVDGRVRLLIELVILGVGSAGFLVAGRPLLSVVLLILIVVHYLVSWKRLRWLTVT